MRNTGFLLSAFLAALAVSTARGDDPAPPGFVSLFNRRDLSGWRIPEGDGGHWKVVDGVIDYDAGSEATGDKALWSDREYTDFVLRLDWRLKEAPFVNKNVPYILPDGTHARDIHGKEIRLALPDADSGVYLRGEGKYQVNIWCWPIGSGEFYGVRTDPKTAPAVRAAVTPRTQADNPVGQWNHFEITVRGSTVTVVLNGKTVIPGATIPDLPPRGRLALQHHGARNKAGEWTGPPSLVQFKNIFIQELAGPGRERASNDGIKALLITGGHEHEASFYSLLADDPSLPSVPVDNSASVFRRDVRGKYDVIVMYDFTRDLDEPARKNLRDFVESGGGIVVLHHALLNYQNWKWWCREAVGGSYRLSREGDVPSSTVKFGQDMAVKPKAAHPITASVGPFRIVDESYKGMAFSPDARVLLTTDNPASDEALAWLSPNPAYRIVAIQLGHGPSAFTNPSYRSLVHNAIVWAARRNP